jgi:hypothetical protein
MKRPSLTDTYIFFKFQTMVKKNQTVQTSYVDKQIGTRVEVNTAYRAKTTRIIVQIVKIISTDYQISGMISNKQFVH